MNMNGGTLNKAALPAIALVLMVFSVYYVALGYGFVYDDNEQILGNRWLLSFSNIPEVFNTHSFGFKEESKLAISYRPMLFVIYMAEYAVFGFSAWGWHLVNILMHSLNSLFVFLILRHLLEAETKGYSSTIPAFAAALVFSVHPANAEPVSWIATMPELTFTFLCLAAFYLEVRSKNAEFFWGIKAMALKAVIALLFLAALLLKETAVVLPVIVFVYDAARKGLRGFLLPASYIRYLPYVAAIAVYTGMRSHALNGAIVPAERLHSFLSPYEFVLNSIVLMARYFKSLVLPLGEPPMQMMDPVFSLSEPRAILSVLIVIAVPAVLALGLRKITRVWALVVAIIILPILPTLYSPAVSRFPFADRYLYFPTVGLAMLIAVVLAWSVSRQKKWARWAVAAILAAALPSAVLAKQKSAVWESDHTLWGAALASQPRNYLAVHLMAVEYLKEGRAAEAVELFENSLQMNLSSERPDHSMLLFTRKALPQACIKAGMDDRAEVHLKEYIKLMPDDVPSLFNLALLYQVKGRCPDAVEFFQQAALFSRESGLSGRIYFNLGECYSAMGMREEAMQSFRKGLTHTPGDSLMRSRMDALGTSAS